MTTSQPEGTEGGSINVDQFLKENKLTYVAEKFKEKDVTIEELFEFTSDELNEWAQSDLGLDTLARKRLVKAVSALKPKEQPLTTNSGLNIQQSSQQSQEFRQFGHGKSGLHVIVSPEEHEAISHLYERFDDTSKLIGDLQSSFELLEKSANDCKLSVNNGFEKILTELGDKKTSLKSEVEIVGNDKKNKLMNQLDSLKQYCSVISNGKKKYEEYISDPDLDIHKRKTAILSMIDSIMNDNNVSLVMVTQPKIGFPVNQKQVEKFVNSLTIDDCDQPFPPLLTVKKIGFSVIEIEWRLDGKQEKFQTSSNKRVLEYAIEWAKIPKSKYKKIKDSKSEKSSKKSKSKSKSSKRSKKSKKKGKKHKNKDSDSSSDSDDEDDDDDVKHADDDSGSESDSSDSSSDSDSSSSDSSDDDSDSDSDSSDSDDSEIRRKLKGSKFEIDSESIDYDKLKWDEIKIKCKTDGKSHKKHKKSSLKNKYKIKELKDETPYLVRLRARNGSGWGNYCLPKTCITKKLTINSKILKDKEKVYLLKLLPKNLKKRKFKLIYRASKDSFSSYKFHAKCDGKGETITIVRSTLNHVFGGYTSIPWAMSSNNYQNDPSAFIFLLRSTRGNAPAKWNVTTPTNAVYHSASYGPTFGGGFDFYLCDNCNSVNSSYANLGNSYAAPKDRNLLAGAYNFMTSDYEVYQLV